MCREGRQWHVDDGTMACPANGNRRQVSMNGSAAIPRVADESSLDRNGSLNVPQVHVTDAFFCEEV